MSSTLVEVSVQFGLEISLIGISLAFKLIFGLITSTDINGQGSCEPQEKRGGGARLLGLDAANLS